MSTQLTSEFDGLKYLATEAKSIMNLYVVTDPNCPKNLLIVDAADARERFLRKHRKDFLKFENVFVIKNIGT